MGGFHGGHSSHHSSGGFHSGSHHSSHSYSSHRSYSSGSHYHSSSSGSSYTSSYSRPTTSYTPIHTMKNGHHYIHGKRYYGAYYGIRHGKPVTLASRIGIAIFLIIFGIFFFTLFFRVQTTATVTHTYTVRDAYGDNYETYDFIYYYNGKPYYGYGDDDLSYSGTYTILEGETYTIYVSPTNPSTYSFENNSGWGFAFLIILGGIGTIILVKSIRIYIHHKKELEAVGDINGDGIIDDKDLEYADSLHQGKSEGAYEGIKKATEENTYQENKVYRRCAYCDSIVEPDDKFCPNCGSNLKEN